MNKFLTLVIEGKDVKRFIARLYNQNIQFYEIEYFDNSVYIKVRYNDYLKITELKTIYSIKIYKYHGILKLYSFLKYYRLFIILFIIGIFSLYLLSNLIFDVCVVHEKEEIRNLVIEELKKYGIDKYHFTKKFDYNEDVVKKIINKYNDKIEWLEIERVGTKYFVKVEERKINSQNNDNLSRNIVAKKRGFLLKINASDGEVLKKINDYVNEGDILISGTIMNKDEIKGYVRANGQVFAETWYTATVEIPNSYKEILYTGKKQIGLKFKFLNNIFYFFNKFSSFNENKIFSFEHHFLPISFSINDFYESIIIDEIYTYDKAILKATSIARDKLLNSLGKDDEIIYEKSLKIYEEDSKIVVVIFFRVKEDITDYQIIVSNNENDDLSVE